MRPRALAVLRAVANRNASGLAVTQNSATGLKFRPSMVGIALTPSTTRWLAGLPLKGRRKFLRSTGDGYGLARRINLNVTAMAASAASAALPAASIA